MKNPKISLLLGQELQDKLKAHAAEKKVTASTVIKNLLRKYLFCEDDSAVVVLRVPSAIKKDEVALRKWLQAKLFAIEKALING